MRISIEGKLTWVNFHHLYCFYVVVTQGGLAKASAVLGIGQSALSIQMRQFEEALGFGLFERSHRKILPNERGKIVMSYAKEIFRLGAEMIETVYDQPTAKRAHLQLGALDTIPKHLTVRVVRHALRESNCTVSVVEGQPESLLKSLTEHRIDLVLANFQPQVEIGRVFARRIARLPLWVVGGRSFLKLKTGFPKSLSGKPFVVPTSDSLVRHEFESFCKRNRVTPDYVAETQDVMVQKLLAQQQIGLTVAPEFAVRDYLEKKELFLIGRLENVFEELFLIAASRRVENPVASLLMDRFQLS